MAAPHAVAPDDLAAFSRHLSIGRNDDKNGLDKVSSMSTRSGRSYGRILYAGIMMGGTEGDGLPGLWLDVGGGWRV
jgi:hypothetical protein